MLTSLLERKRTRSIFTPTNGSWISELPNKTDTAFLAVVQWVATVMADALLASDRFTGLRLAHVARFFLQQIRGSETTSTSTPTGTIQTQPHVQLLTDSLFSNKLLLQSVLGAEKMKSIQEENLGSKFTLALVHNPVELGTKMGTLRGRDFSLPELEYDILSFGPRQGAGSREVGEDEIEVAYTGETEVFEDSSIGEEVDGQEGAAEQALSRPVRSSLVVGLDLDVLLQRAPKRLAELGTEDQAVVLEAVAHALDLEIMDVMWKKIRSALGSRNLLGGEEGPTGPPHAVPVEAVLFADCDPSVVRAIVFPRLRKLLDDFSESSSTEPGAGALAQLLLRSDKIIRDDQSGTDGGFSRIAQIGIQEYFLSRRPHGDKLQRAALDAFDASKKNRSSLGEVARLDRVWIVEGRAFEEVLLGGGRSFGEARADLRARVEEALAARPDVGVEPRIWRGQLPGEGERKRPLPHGWGSMVWTRRGHVLATYVGWFSYGKFGAQSEMEKERLSALPVHPVGCSGLPEPVFNVARHSNGQMRFFKQVVGSSVTAVTMDGVFINRQKHGPGRVSFHAVADDRRRVFYGKWVHDRILGGEMIAPGFDVLGIYQTKYGSRSYQRGKVAVNSAPHGVQLLTGRFDIEDDYGVAWEGPMSVWQSGWPKEAKFVGALYHGPIRAGVTHADDGILIRNVVLRDSHAEEFHVSSDDGRPQKSGEDLADNLRRLGFRVLSAEAAYSGGVCAGMRQHGIGHETRFRMVAKDEKNQQCEEEEENDSDNWAPLTAPARGGSTTWCVRAASAGEQPRPVVRISKFGVWHRNAFDGVGLVLPQILQRRDDFLPKHETGIRRKARILSLFLGSFRQNAPTGSGAYIELGTQDGLIGNRQARPLKTLDSLRY